MSRYTLVQLRVVKVSQVQTTAGLIYRVGHRVGRQFGLGAPTC